MKIIEQYSNIVIAPFEAIQKSQIEGRIKYNEKKIQVLDNLIFEYYKKLEILVNRELDFNEKLKRKLKKRY